MAGNTEQGTSNREQGTGNREQGTGNREQGAGNRRAAGDRPIVLSNTGRVETRRAASDRPIVLSNTGRVETRRAHSARPYNFIKYRPGGNKAGAQCAPLHSNPYLLYASCLLTADR